VAKLINTPELKGADIDFPELFERGVVERRCRQLTAPADHRLAEAQFS